MAHDAADDVENYRRYGLITKIFHYGIDDATFETVNTGDLNGIARIQETADLPDPSNGTHTLDDDTAYFFDGFVASSDALELGNPSPLLASHGGIGGFIYTGGAGAAIRGTDVPFFARDISVSAPGADAMDLSADSTTEMLVESVSFADFANLGEFTSLGTIDGFRVQTFKGVNFENFAGGLTLTGPTDKTFFEGCPFRNVTASDVAIIQTDTNYQAELLKVSTDCYIKSVQPDTEVVRVPSGGEPSNYFKYYNVDHPDGTVTKSNILNGEIATGKVGTIVRNSFPLADSTVAGDLTLDSLVTVTGSGDGSTEITQGTWTLNLGEKVSKASAGVLQFDAKADRNAKITAKVVISGSNTEFALWIAKNGTVIPRSRTEASTSGASKPIAVNYGVQVPKVTSDTPDQFSVFVENIGGTADLDANAVNLELQKV